jgi:hypothetical protein
MLATHSITLLNYMFLIVFALRISSFKKDSFIWLCLASLISASSVLMNQHSNLGYLIGFMQYLPEMIISIFAIFIFYKTTLSLKFLSKNALVYIMIFLVIYIPYIFMMTPLAYVISNGNNSQIVVYTMSITFSILPFIGYILLIQGCILGFILCPIYSLYILIFRLYYLTDDHDLFSLIEIANHVILLLIYTKAYISHRSKLLKI